MTRLHDALDAIAQEAPPVDLAERAIGTARRGRFRTLASVAAAALLVCGGGAVALNRYGGDDQRTISTQVSDVLPDRDVGSARYAYLDWCKRDWKPGVNTSSFAGECAQWRIVTEEGRTFRMPQALGVYTEQSGEKYMNDSAPLVISRDGRRIAYYSEQDPTVRVRDLASGEEWPVGTAVDRASLVQHGGLIRLSPDGRYVAVAGDPREPGLLLDTSSGRSRPIPTGWWPRFISQEGVLLMIKNEDQISTMSLDGERAPTVLSKDLRPLRGVLALDGRTIAMLTEGDRPDKVSPEGIGPVNPKPDSVTIFDVGTGEVRSSVKLRGAPKGLWAMGPGGWLDEDRLLISVPSGRLDSATPRSGGPGAGDGLWDMGQTAFAVNVRTGQVHEIGTYPLRAQTANVIVPGL
ncbi:hypothetical protein [Sphaerisporangium perillae]|uniref:hypothetical protein n=1 Tax=Sphaerisporangium perillae TaxID=2935860 RepID=UPI00200C7DCB|nr:hypothetical protein [Sphaerisporangium perillae]